MAQTKSTSPATMSMLDHIGELRRRLIMSACIFAAAFAISFAYAEQLFAFLAAPLTEQLVARGIERGLIYTALGEVFIAYLTIAFYAALFISFPVIANQLWRFVAPGLYAREKKALRPFLIATPMLFLAGALIAYYGLFPLAWAFFLDFDSSSGAPIRLEAKVSSYLDLSLRLIFAFGVVFLLPVLLILLNKTGLVQADHLRRWRKFVIIIAFGLAAILTPPDVISQIALAIPLLVLYELSLFVITVGARKSEKR